MNQKETLERFKTWCKNTLGDNCSADDYRMASNIIDLLKRDICYDCVSRQEALEKFKPKGISDEVWKECDSYKKIMSLESVTCPEKPEIATDEEVEEFV